MNNKVAAVILGVVALGVGAWIGRDSAAMSSAVRAVGGRSGNVAPATGETLAAAGVHKCQAGGRIFYLDSPCPKGSRELVANGGTVTVMSFPKAAPAPASEAAASGIAGGRLVKGMSREEIDRMREKQVDDAANR
jgi:hypothetical protein